MIYPVVKVNHLRFGDDEGQYREVPFYAELLNDPREDDPYVIVAIRDYGEGTNIEVAGCYVYTVAWKDCEATLLSVDRTRDLDNPDTWEPIHTPVYGA